MTLSGYVTLIYIVFYDFNFPFSIAKIYQTLETMSDLIAKHLEVPQNSLMSRNAG